MEHYTIVLLILVVMIVLSAIADRLKLPAPILLICAGIAIGFIPAMPHIELDPEIIFLIFLPPLLYDAAFNISFKEFRTHIRTISILAIGLVFLTTLGIAVFAHLIIPGMSWPVSFVLGAILSATDAVAAIGITKGLGLSHKTLTILEGESLINDASALVAYRLAVAAVTGTAFVLWKASLIFLLLMAGGVITGWVMAKILALLLKKAGQNNLVTISFMLVMPFVTYLLAEHLHVSGVIAVVVLGLSISRFTKQVFPEELKMQSRSFWDTIIFLLNGLIFILIGLEFPFVLQNIEKIQILPFIGYAFLITIVALAIRMVRVFLHRLNLKRSFRYKSDRMSEDELLDSQTGIIISWAGMRGIISLAIALGLPFFLDNGDPFPQRNTIIFISVAVVLFTLLGQGLTLPWIVKRFKRSG